MRQVYISTLVLSQIKNNNNNNNNKKRSSDGWYRLSIRNETAQELIEVMAPGESHDSVISRLIKEHNNRKLANNNGDPLSLEQIDQALTEMTIRKEK